MRKRLRILGIGLMVVAVGFGVASGIAYSRVQDGYGSLQAFSEAQDVTLSYNEDGQLIDRGTTEGADAIMALLKDEWNYPVVASDLDPDNPLVNTGTEYMYQMATITYHVLHGTQEVTLAEDVEYNGEVFEAGTYDVPVDGRYWTGFDRMHPLEGPARGQAWTGTVHGLVGELGVGTVTHSTLQMGLALSGVLAGLALVLLGTGGTLVWAMRAEEEEEDEEIDEIETIEVPDTVPDDLVVMATA